MAKSKRYVDLFETLNGVFAFNIWINGVTLLTTIGLLLWVTPFLAVIFGMRLVFYILISIQLASDTFKMLSKN